MLLKRVLVLALAMLVGRSAAAQSRVLTAREVYDMYFRLAAVLGKSQREAQAVWPLPARPEGAGGFLEPTAAHRLRLSFGSVLTAVPRDSTTRASMLSLWEIPADTAALREHVTELLARLQQQLGAPDRCTGAFGPPAYLHAPQDVVRYWSKGFGGYPTHLRWMVDLNNGAPSLSIELTAGWLTPEPTMATSCTLRMP